MHLGGLQINSGLTQFFHFLRTNDSMNKGILSQLVPRDPPRCFIQSQSPTFPKFWGTCCYYTFWQFHDIFYRHLSHTDSAHGWGNMSHTFSVVFKVPSIVLDKQKASNKSLLIRGQCNVKYSWQEETRFKDYCILWAEIKH